MFPIELFASSLSLIKKLNRLNGAVIPSAFLSKMSQSEILCGVCLDSLGANSESEILLTCQHQFHEACVEPWLAQKGTCPTCRTRIREVEESDDELDDETVQNLFENIESIRTSVMTFWQQRTTMDLQAIIQQVQEEREAREAQRQAQTGMRLEEYAARVRIIRETDQEWIYEVDGQPGRSLKNDVAIVQTQTEAGFLTCIYAMHSYENDIVNSILDITGV